MPCFFSLFPQKFPEMRFILLCTYVCYKTISKYKLSLIRRLRVLPSVWSIFTECYAKANSLTKGEENVLFIKKKTRETLNISAIAAVLLKYSTVAKMTFTMDAFQGIITTA